MSESSPQNPHRTPAEAAADMKRLLGLRDFPIRTHQEQLNFLHSEVRVSALAHIDTTTMPRKKREIKKGVVLEVLEKKLLNEAFLQKYPLVYIGSGTDVEYPLALGARTVVLVDPIFKVPEACTEVEQKIASLIQTTPKRTSEHTYEFQFDYGSEVEPATVVLVAEPFVSDDSSQHGYTLPAEVGVILLFATQGPGGKVSVNDGMLRHLVEGGLVIEEHTVYTKQGVQSQLGT